MTNQIPPLANRLESRGLIAVTGLDRTAFLQGLVTQDVTLVAPDRMIYAAMLTAQGRFSFDLFIVETGDALWLDCDYGRREALIAKLQRHKLRSAVEIHDLSASHGIAISLQPPPATGYALPDPRHAALGWRMMLPRAALPAADRAVAEEWDRTRIVLGIPDPQKDMIAGESLPLEFRFDRLNAISYSKGCYMGQEMTARMHYRALIKRQLYRVRFDGRYAGFGSTITADGQECGSLLSGYDGMALAYLKIEAVESGLPLLCGADILKADMPLQDVQKDKT